MRRKGFTLIELMIVIAIIAVIAAIAIPGLLAAQRASNERNASASLKTLGTAEADFRSNDRDGNVVNDFWTGDVAGLCIIRPLDSTGAVAPDGPTAGIRLIEPSVAAADGDATVGLALYTTEQVVPNRPFTIYQPKAGYVYVAAASENPAQVPALRFDTDTSGAYLACHNMDRFAFLAVPNTLSSGRLAFILNQDQDNTMYKINLATNYASGYAGGATTSAVTITNSGSAIINAEQYPMNPSANGFSKMD
jgi:prepilin-type N-terminal cleavage/methylation domain-containing protein